MNFKSLLAILLIELVAGCATTATDGGEKPKADPNSVPADALYYTLPKTVLSLKINVEESFALFTDADTGAIYAHPTYRVTGTELTSANEIDPDTGYFLLPTSGFWKQGKFSIEVSPEGFPSKGSTTQAGPGYIAVSFIKEAISIVAPIVKLAAGMKGGREPTEAEIASVLFQRQYEVLQRILAAQKDLREVTGWDEAAVKKREAIAKAIVELRAGITTPLTFVARLDSTRQGNELIFKVVTPLGSKRSWEGALARRGIVRYEIVPTVETKAEILGPLKDKRNSPQVPTREPNTNPIMTTDGLVFRLPAPAHITSTMTFKSEAFFAGKPLANQVSPEITLLSQQAVTITQAGPLSIIQAKPGFFKQTTVTVSYHPNGTLATLGASDTGVSGMVSQIATDATTIQTALRPPSETERIKAAADLNEARIRLLTSEETLRALQNADQPKIPNAP